MLFGLVLIQFWLPSADADLPSASPSPVAAATSPVGLDAARIANETAQADYYRKQAAAPPKKDSPWWETTLVSPLTGFAVAGLTLLLTNLLSDKKAGREHQQLYYRQKTQVRLAVDSLDAALGRMNLDDLVHPPAFLRRDLLPSQPPQPATFNRNDPYYKKYDLVSSIYRLCAMLGWIELYRTDPAFLNGPKMERETIQSTFQDITGILREDYKEEKARLLAQHPANGFWRDGAILEDDQRAIGERMLTTPDKDTPPTVIGYAKFCEDLFGYPDVDKPAQDPGKKPKDNKPQDHWIWNATSFVVGMGDLPPALDFRNRRFAKLRDKLEILQGVLSIEEPRKSFAGLFARFTRKKTRPASATGRPGTGPSPSPPRA